MKNLCDFFEKTGTYVHMSPKAQQIHDAKMANNSVRKPKPKKKK